MRLPVVEHAAGEPEEPAEAAVQWPSQRWSRERQTSPAPAAEEATAVEQPAAAEVAAEAPAPEQEAEEAAVAPEEELAAARGGDGGGACGRPRWRRPRARSARYAREILQARRRCSAASAS